MRTGTYQIDSKVILVPVAQLLIPGVPLRTAENLLNLLVILDLFEQPPFHDPWYDSLECANRSAAVSLVGVADEGLVALVDLVAVGGLSFAEAVACVVSC